MKPERYFVIDFDSTFTQTESPGELAAISLKDDPDKEKIVAEIERMTDAAMEGKLSMTEALAKRLRLQKAHRKHIDALIKVLKKKITPSVARNKKFFKEYGKNIFILSAGFKEFIVPVVKPFGIPEKNVFANTFVFDKEGAIIGLDEKNPLSRDKGKLEQFKSSTSKARCTSSATGTRITSSKNPARSRSSSRSRKTFPATSS